MYLYADGGAIALKVRVSTTLESCNISNNRAGSLVSIKIASKNPKNWKKNNVSHVKQGGAVALDGSSVVYLRTSMLGGNSARDGGAVAARATANIITHTTVFVCCFCWFSCVVYSHLFQLKVFFDNTALGDTGMGGKFFLKRLQLKSIE